MKRIITASLIIAFAIGSAACSDRPTATPDNPVTTNLPAGLTISSAMPITPGNGVSVSSAGGNEVAYVSMAPQTYADAVSFEIRNQTSGGTSQVYAAVDGGLDPVAVPAHAGDLLALTVRAAGVTTTLTLAVPVRRPPVVVRTNPAKGRVDVALNINVSVVFSEPIDPRTLDSAALQLLHDGNPSRGSVRLADNAWTAEFAPETSLLPLATYALLVTQRIRDFNGDSLAAPYRSTFTTCPFYAIPSNCPPFPTGGASVISGIVNERTPGGLMPAAGVKVFAWVQKSNGDGYSRGGILSDATGHFLIDGLPEEFILLEADKQGFDQPCGWSTQLSGPAATASLEVVSQDHPIPEAATAKPSITGVVFEVTPNGRQPVAGARIYFDAAMDLIAATTTTDANGRYALCSLPAVWNLQTVYAQKTGYALADSTVSVSGAMQLDFQLKH